jgi:DNA polymerase V
VSGVWSPALSINSEFVRAMKNVFALVDCNNFYGSCERLFRPELNGQPVIVLSNNDGCIVARSNEAKALGIPMGAPLFKVKHLIAGHKVHVFSSNYALYPKFPSYCNEEGGFTPNLV